MLLGLQAIDIISRVMATQNQNPMARACMLRGVHRGAVLIPITRTASNTGWQNRAFQLLPEQVAGILIMLEQTFCHHAASICPTSGLPGHSLAPGHKVRWPTHCAWIGTAVAASTMQPDSH